jgi:hypothetical protein
MPWPVGWGHTEAKTAQATSAEVGKTMHFTFSRLILWRTGLWAGTIGTRRLLRLFEKYNIKASWFIPGHSLETFPEECAMVRDAGHEIGVSEVSHR